jgi:hypothetical protein
MINTTPNDRFDLERLRLPQNFADQMGVKKVRTTIPIRRPDRQWWIRVHPEETWRMPVYLLQLKEDRDRETYVVDPSLARELSGELAPAMLFTAINRQDVIFLWEVRLPGEDGRHNPWHRSAYEAAQLAMDHWVRVSSNMSLGAYEVAKASADLPTPQWPEEGFSALLELAVRDRRIDNMDHPIVRRLRGAI